MRTFLIKISIISTLFIFIISPLYSGDTIKIMPIGNSITAGEHYNYPAINERTGYRKDLYQMLINSGYYVDFVGSQKHGMRPEIDKDYYDWNCEAYPGWTIPRISEMVENELPNYQPDILLVHVGTNGDDWNKKPAQVMDMLDMMNKYSTEYYQPMTVFLCKIINRFKGGHAPTTQFNNEVTDLVAARKGDKLRIIIIDMENGAGLDYTDNSPDPTSNPPYEGGDMWGEKYTGVSYDLFHPNNKGNTKMAAKLHEALVKELGSSDTIENKCVNQE
jgi:lysophospholipase L1-like esterase